jgi:hypothetical protein
MATPAPNPETAIVVRIFDGSREAFPSPKDILLTIKDGDQRQIVRDFIDSSSVKTPVIPTGTSADNYTVIAFAKGYKQAGFFPVKIRPLSTQIVDIMLVPPARRSQFNFARSTWTALGQNWKELKALLTAGVSSDTAAGKRYGDLMESSAGAPLACLLNLCEAASQLNLPEKTAFDYLREIVFEKAGDAKPPAPDRFFAWVDPALIQQMVTAEQQGVVTPAPFALHPGATRSWKQIQFGEANLQFTFHENDTDAGRVLLELDIDYFRDMAAHLVLEVLVNGLTQSVTDPRDVYVLRWIAGRRAGVPEFDPLYTIQKA